MNKALMQFEIMRMPMTRDLEEEEIDENKGYSEINFNLRKALYLTNMDGVCFEECGHIILKIKIESYQEVKAVLQRANQKKKKA